MIKDKKTEAKKEIKKILSNIDNIAEGSKFLHEIAGEYQKVRDTYFNELKDEKNAKKMQTLMDVFNFVIKDGKLSEMMSGTTGDGKPWSYPTLASFNEKSFKLIEKELNMAKSNKIKARHADFLWITKRDHIKAKYAVDAYLNLINEYEKNDKSTPDQHFGLDVLESFNRAFQLSKAVNYKKSEVSKKFERLLFEFNPLSSSKAKLTIDMVELAINNRKDFKDIDFWKKLVILCEEQVERLLNENKQYFAREYLLNIKKIEELVLKKKTKKWDIKIAESYVSEADDHKNRKSFAELSSLIKAVEEYSKLKDYAKVEELKKRYKASAGSVEFHEISTKIDISDVIKNAKSRAKKISKLKPEEIIKVLVVSPNFFPTFDHMEKMVNDQSKKFITQALFGKSVFDGNMNQVRIYSSDEEKHFASILEQFGLGISIYRHEIEIVMMELVNKKALSWKDISAYFKKYSWFGMIFEMKNRKGEVVLKTRKIMDLIEPGIKQYLKAAKKSSAGKKIPFQEIMLATDSLVVKIEGIIREMYQFLGKPTFVVRNDKGGKSITYEKDLNNFLSDDFMEAILGKDLILLMRYLLTEPIGHNLRNNVGHCLIQKEHYSMLNLHFLFIILLRLGNYKFELAKNKK
ncbi:MAG: DUF4209 domain-containing protein [Desulforegulaceae bacterium]|jgi:hypothetical protein|nr:DUF4209 domain-containing protein [Desulforegulaceae bacterium]